MTAAGGPQRLLAGRAVSRRGRMRDGADSGDCRRAFRQTGKSASEVAACEVDAEGRTPRAMNPWQRTW